MASSRVTVPIQDLHLHLRGYQAEIERDYSNANRHVYFSRPMGKWITVRRRGQRAELEFTDDCPCSYEH